MARRNLPKPENDADVAVEEPEEEAEGEQEAPDEEERRKDKEEDFDDEMEDDELGEGGGDPRIHRIGEVVQLHDPEDRAGGTPGDIAARLQTPGSTAAARLSWSSGYTDPDWEQPRRPVQDIIKILGKVEYIGGYRRPAEVFRDWIELVECTLHMLPQHVLYARLHGTLMPPDEEPEQVKAVFARVMKIYGEHWKEVSPLFNQAYDILTKVAQGIPTDLLGALYMGLEIGNVRMGQFFTPTSITSTMADMLLPDIEGDVIGFMAEAIDAWEGKATYELMGMRWGKEHPETTRYIWEKNLDPLYYTTRRLKILEPCSGAGGMLISAIAATPPWIVNLQLAEYYAVDLDPLCAQMTRVQLLLYGANGYALLCQLPMVAPNDDLPTFEQLEHRYQQIASYAQCGNSLATDWELNADGVWELIHWAESQAGKARMAERAAEQATEQAQAAVVKEQQKAVSKVKAVKDRAKAKGQELLFDIELPPIEDRASMAADAAHTNGNGNGHANGNGNGHTNGDAVPGAAGDWDTFVEKAKAVKGTPAAVAGAAVATVVVEQLAEELTQGEMF